MTDVVDFHLELTLTKMFRRICDNEDEKGTLGSSFYDLIHETKSKCQQKIYTIILLSGKYGKTLNDPRDGRLMFDSISLDHF